jgi:hypothetical protein
MVTKSPAQDDAQADGILRFILERGRHTRRQIAWLIGYVQRLRKRSRPQEKS